ALVHTDELPLLGVHNVANALFAALAVVLAGADVEGVRRGLLQAVPLPHRLEPVAEVDGVLWINDSKATNLASARSGIGAMARPTILLLGGRHKGEPYTALLPEIEEHVKAVVAYGEAGELVQADLEGHARVALVTGSFDEVVEQAAELASPGDAVLLSPACASFDMFRDFEERGERFTELVRRRQEVPRGA
ncbi:MAG TPA: cyanophycin synthetase, partial [Longimicrobiales bacterium]|nr:cyanophycin synthetase [Longimicrobiales bacterium]